MRKLVSIIVPTYNNEKYISRCLDSIISQTYKNIEIVIINDGCKDNTPSIIRQYEKKDCRIITVNQDNNGVQYSRKIGFNISNGDYVFFIDSDDWINSDTIEKLINYSKVYDADIVKCLYIKEYGSKNVKRKITPMYEKITLVNSADFHNLIYPKMINSYFFSNIWGQLIKRESILEDYFNKDLKYAEDLDFNINLLNKSKNILLVPEYFYHYYDNCDGSINKVTYELLNIRINDTINVYFKMYEKIGGKIEELTINKKDILLRVLDELSGILVLISKLQCNQEKKLQIIYNTFNDVKVKKIINDIDESDINLCNLRHKKVIKCIYYKNAKGIILYSIFFNIKSNVKNIIKKLLKNRKEKL